LHLRLPGRLGLSLARRHILLSRLGLGLHLRLSGRLGLSLTRRLILDAQVRLLPRQGVGFQLRLAGGCGVGRLPGLGLQRRLTGSELRLLIGQGGALGVGPGLSLLGSLLCG
jgi:hypothetical protein